MSSAPFIHVHPPWWGHPTANVDWCEHNYADSPFIAEFYNSLSSVLMIVWGLIGAWSSYKCGLQKRFILAQGFLALVGLGSVAFHATLLYSCQMLDELPMILGCLVFLFIVLDLYDGEKKPTHTYSSCWRESVLISFLIAYGILTTLFMALWTHRFSYFAHVHDNISPLPMNLSYIFLVITMVVRSFLIYKKTKDPAVSFYYQLAIACYLTGAACWLTEKFFCGSFELTRYLHAVWHLGAGFGTYVFIQWTAYVHYNEIGKRPRWVTKLWTPMLSMNKTV